MGIGEVVNTQGFDPCIRPFESDMLSCTFCTQKSREGVVFLDYVITNPSKEVYIMLNGKGVPVTCAKSRAQRFESSKARNLVDNLPKTLKRFHFRVEAIPEIVEHKEESVKETEDKAIIKSYKETSESAKRWIDRSTECSKFTNDASERKSELTKMLQSADRDLSNCLHSIELSGWKNGCAGYKAYKDIKTILEKRREIKDELLVLTTILSLNVSNVTSERIQKIVGGLENRVFTIREVEDYENI